MIIKFLPILVMFFIAAIFLIIFFAVDRYLTNKRIKINQLAWDEFSKGMTDREKMNCFMDFLYRQQEKYGWSCLYIPWIGIGEVNADEDSD